MKLVGDAERRAAQAEARLQANGVMMQFLRDRAEELQRRVDGQPVRMTEPESALQRLEDEIRRLRSTSPGAAAVRRRASAPCSCVLDDAAVGVCGVLPGTAQPLPAG